MIRPLWRNQVGDLYEHFATLFFPLIDGLGFLGAGGHVLIRLWGSFRFLVFFFLFSLLSLLIMKLNKGQRDPIETGLNWVGNRNRMLQYVIYIYIYNRNFWNSHNFLRQHGIKRKIIKPKPQKKKKKVINPFPTRLCLFFSRFPFHEYSTITFLPAPPLPALPQSNPRQANQTHDNSTPNPSNLPFLILCLSLLHGKTQQTSDHQFTTNFFRPSISWLS